MEASAYDLRALDEATWPAFAALVERNNGTFGGCWCMSFHPERVGKGSTAEVNREGKLACQFGTPEEPPRIGTAPRRSRARWT